jgi:hypothetical protein
MQKNGQKNGQRRKTIKRRNKVGGSEKAPNVTKINYEEIQNFAKEVIGYVSCKTRNIADPEKYPLCDKIYNLNFDLVNTIRTGDYHWVSDEIERVLFLYDVDDNEKFEKLPNTYNNVFQKRYCDTPNRFTNTINRFASMKYVYDAANSEALNTDEYGKYISVYIPFKFLSWRLDKLPGKILTAVRTGQKAYEVKVYIDLIFTPALVEKMEDIDNDINNYTSCMRDSSNWFGGKTRKHNRSLRKKHRKRII